MYSWTCFLLLQQHWLGGAKAATGAAKALVVGALVALFVSVPVYLTVIKGYRMAVSTTDYQLIESELSRLATLRSRLVNAGMVLAGVAAILLVIAIV
jgi:hypothetical protein